MSKSRSSCMASQQGCLWNSVIIRMHALKFLLFLEVCVQQNVTFGKNEKFVTCEHVNQFPMLSFHPSLVFAAV